MALKVKMKVTTMTNSESKQKAMEAAGGIFGVDSIAADLKGQKLTVIGQMDAVDMENKLNKAKAVKVQLISVVPADGNCLQKVVMKVTTMTDCKSKQKAMEAASGIFGVDSITTDLKEKKLMVIGRMDAVDMENKLNKVKAMKVQLISAVPVKTAKKK